MTFAALARRRHNIYCIRLNFFFFLTSSLSLIFPCRQVFFIHSAKENWTWFFFFLSFISLVFVSIARRKRQCNFCRTLRYSTRVYEQCYNCCWSDYLLAELAWFPVRGCAQCFVFIVRVIERCSLFWTNAKHSRQIHACCLKDTTKSKVVLTTFFT